MAASSASLFSGWRENLGSVVNSAVSTVRGNVSVLPPPELPKDLTPFRNKATDLVKIILKQKQSEENNVPRELQEYVLNLIESDFPTKYLALICNCVAEKIFELTLQSSDNKRVLFIRRLCAKAVMMRQRDEDLIRCSIEQAHGIALQLDSPGYYVDVVLAFLRAGLERFQRPKKIANDFFEEIKSRDIFNELFFKLLSGYGVDPGEEVSKKFVEEYVDKIIQKLEGGFDTEKRHQICGAWSLALVRMSVHAISQSQQRWGDIFGNEAIVRSLREICSKDITKNLNVRQEKDRKKREMQAGGSSLQPASPSSFESNSFMEYLERFFKIEIAILKTEFSDKTMPIKVFQLLSGLCSGEHKENNMAVLEAWFCKNFKLRKAEINAPF